MATHRQLIAQIRFQLDQLSVRNAQHEFEHLCRHLARNRICSNILPATGPVAAGGDQGRDAETFRTFLARSPLADSVFVGLVADEPVAFAMTLQRRTNNLKRKIRDDVEKILESGQPVPVIYHFCADDLPISDRHEVQNWARDDLHVELHIIDGQAISEMLADRDVFWIAAEFLEVPSEIYPEEPGDQDDEWYVELLVSWRANPDRHQTFAHFAEVKTALRRATFASERKPDLSFWLGRMETFISDAVPQVLRLRAIYEVSVAVLRGHGSLEGQEDKLREYFATVVEAPHTSDLQDASVLVTYCLGAIRHKATHLEVSEVQAWRESVAEEVNARLKRTHSPGRRCELLHVSGFLALQRRLLGDRDSGRSAVGVWLQLTELVRAAPLFPLEEFADDLTQYLAFIGDDPGYEELTHRIDDLLAERVGQFAAAEKCRDRAIAFYKRGKILRAIAELHDAKIKWFAEETLRGSVLAMLFLGQCYAQLGLFYAAKYYSMAAAWVAFESSRSEIQRSAPQALAQAAKIEYGIGNWRSWLQLTDLAVKSHGQFSKDAGDLSKHYELEEFWSYATAVLAATESLDPHLTELVTARISAWGLEELVQDLLPEARDFWRDKSANDVLFTIAAQLAVTPFSDLMPEREAVWLGLGITWRVRWSNDYETTLAAEQLISALQISLADFARHDLCLLATTVDITVSLGRSDAPQVEDEHTNQGRRWHVALPEVAIDATHSIEQQTASLLGVAVYILREVSLLPEADFTTAFEDAVNKGILTKAFVVRSYGALFRDLQPSNSLLETTGVPAFLQAATKQLQPPSAHADLDYSSDLAPMYSSEEALATVTRRYERIPQMYPVTLATLGVDSGFQGIVQRLRREGWRDWHLLLAIANIVTNYRMRHLQDSGHPILSDPSNFKSEYLKVSSDLSQEVHFPVPLSEFTEDNLRMHLDFSMASTLKGWGLETHQAVPDFPAIRRFLRDRLRYWEDDIQHEDPFSREGGKLILVTSPVD